MSGPGPTSNHIDIGLRKPPLASDLRRFAAFLVDGVLVFVYLLCVGIALEVHRPDWLRPATVLLCMIVPPAYFVLLDASPLGGTLGKMALGLKVVGHDGKRIGVPQSLARTAGKAFCLFFCVPLAYFGLILHDKSPSMKPYDRLTGCMVVYRWPTPPPPQHPEVVTTRGGVREEAGP